MIEIDDFVKIILAVSITFAIVIISYSLARILFTIHTILKDIRTPIRNAGTVSDLMVEDYNTIRKFFYGLKDIANFFNFLGRIKSRFGSVNSKKEDETKAEQKSK